MSGKRHPWGCTCSSHVDRAWNRPEHWSVSDVDFLSERFGHWSDERLARHLGRSVLGIRLKAKRLGLHKREAGFTGRKVGEIFGVDSAVVGKVWIRRGLMRARRAAIREYDGRVVFWAVSPKAVEAFIREHPECVDVDKMPDSPYRDLAARDPWVSLVEVHRLTGRDHHSVARMIGEGRIRGARRGTHWYVPLADVPLVPPLRSLDRIEESFWRRESVLAMRRARRKGISPTPGDRRSSVPVLLAKVAS